MSRSGERRQARATRTDRGRQAAASASRREDCAPRASARSICACQSAADIGSLCVTASRSETAVAGRCERPLLRSMPAQRLGLIRQAHAHETPAEPPAPRRQTRATPMARPIGGSEQPEPEPGNAQEQPKQGQKCRQRRPDLLPQERHARVMDGPVQQTRAGTRAANGRKYLFPEDLGSGVPSSDSRHPALTESLSCDASSMHPERGDASHPCTAILAVPEPKPASKPGRQPIEPNQCVGYRGGAGSQTIDRP